MPDDLPDIIQLAEQRGIENVHSPSTPASVVISTTSSGQQSEGLE